MNRRIVSCPSCGLQFSSAREKTICPSCHSEVDTGLR